MKNCFNAKEISSYKEISGIKNCEVIIDNYSDCKSFVLEFIEFSDIHDISRYNNREAWKREISKLNSEDDFNRILKRNGICVFGKESSTIYRNSNNRYTDGRRTYFYHKNKFSVELI